MLKGKVTWINLDRGFGFIQPDDVSEDVFVHIQEVERAGYKSLIDNQRIEYVLSTKKSKHCAVNLQLI